MCSKFSARLPGHILDANICMSLANIDEHLFNYLMLLQLNLTCSQSSTNGWPAQPLFTWVSWKSKGLLLSKQFTREYRIHTEAVWVHLSLRIFWILLLQLSFPMLRGFLFWNTVFEKVWHYSRAGSRTPKLVSEVACRGAVYCAYLARNSFRVAGIFFCAVFKLSFFFFGCFFHLSFKLYSVGICAYWTV